MISDRITVSNWTRRIKNIPERGDGNVFGSTPSCAACINKKHPRKRGRKLNLSIFSNNLSLFSKIKNIPERGDGNSYASPMYSIDCNVVLE